MTEKDLIAKLQELKQIEPRKDWVFLTKNSILSQRVQLVQEERPSIFSLLVFARRPALVSLVLAGLVIWTFTFAQNSLPGDLLYPLKRTTEKIHSLFIPEEKRPKFTLEMTEKRLEELNRVVQTGATRKLFPAITEVEASTKEAAKEVSRVVKEKGGEEALRSIEKYVERRDKTRQVFGALGVEPITSQEDEKLYVEFLIGEWEKRDLSESQEELLKTAKEFFDKGDYSSALHILVRQNQLQILKDEPGENNPLEGSKREEIRGDNLGDNLDRDEDIGRGNNPYTAPPVDRLGSW